MNLRIAEPSYTKNEAIKMGRILIVDDEVDICIMLKKHLEKLNFEVDYVATVKHAIEYLDTQNYDALFVDLNLLEGSGYDVMKYVIKIGVLSRIIVISAHDSEQYRVIEKGADIFIAKPFTTRRINEALTTLNLLPS